MRSSWRRAADAVQRGGYLNWRRFRPWDQTLRTKAGVSRRVMAEIEDGISDGLVDDDPDLIEQVMRTEMTWLVQGALDTFED